MYPTSLAVLSVAVLVAVAPVAARADDPIDLEHARALARAGWAMGSYDAELLSPGAAQAEPTAHTVPTMATIARGVTCPGTEPGTPDRNPWLT